MVKRGGGLAALKGLIDDLEAKLDHASHGLAALKALIDAVEDKLDHPSHGLANLKTLIDDLEAKLDNAVYGLSALRALIVAVGVDVVAVGAALVSHDIDIKILINALNDLSAAEVWAFATRTLTAHVFPFTNPLAALDVSNIRTAAYTLLIDGTFGLAALNTDLDKLLTGIIRGTGTVLPANKSLYDILWVDRHLDEQDSFLWDTSVYTTSETDISTLFTTNLTGTTRRKYWVYLDMTGPAGDAAAWTKCTVKVKVKIDGSNYRTIAKAEKAKTDLVATAEPGIPIEVPPVAKDVQITMQFDVALAGDQTIYYHFVEEKMEY